MSAVRHLAPTPRRRRWSCLSLFLGAAAFYFGVGGALLALALALAARHAPAPAKPVPAMPAAQPADLPPPSRPAAPM